MLTTHDAHTQRMGGTRAAAALKKAFSRSTLALFVAMLLVTANPMRSQPVTFKIIDLPSLPDTPGVAGPFVGVSGDVLVMAGGANFPDRPVWEGGAKVWHDTIYALTSPRDAWQVVGRLSQPLAYGVSINTDQGILCIGGSDADQGSARTFFLSLENGQAVERDFVPLPRPVVSAGGMRIGSHVYVAGGHPQSNPMAMPALSSFYRLDLEANEPKWEVLPTWSGPDRIYPVVGSDGRHLYLVSGFRPAFDSNPAKPTLQFLTDAYRFDTLDQTWTRLPDLARPNGAAPSPTLWHHGRLLLLGNGSDGSNLDLPMQQRPALGGEVTAYNPQTQRWDTVGELPFGLVAVPTTQWRGMTVLVSGEPRGGTRTPAARGLVVTAP